MSLHALSHSQVKQQLGIEQLLLQIHDGSFPSNVEEDCGRGSPYSQGAERFFEFAARLGFDGIQLGPQGKTERGNPSPYDSTLFSRNPLNLPLGKYVAQGRLANSTWKQIQATLAAPPQPIEQTRIDDVFSLACQELFASASTTELAAAETFLAKNSAWLIPDALYPQLCREHSAAWWRAWGDSPQAQLDQRLFAPRAGEASVAAARLSALQLQYAAEIKQYAWIQWLLSVEHEHLRNRLKQWNLTLYADLQVGLAPVDAWVFQSLFLPSYLMGAPPSRTNPAGQPWGYAVVDPRKFGTLAEPGEVLAKLVSARLEKVLAECDGMRIDHPHGWIDPWVYRTDDADPFHAVQHGARLFSSPRVVDHAELATWAIANEAQINPAELPYADARVTNLSPEQVARYAIFIDLIVQTLQKQNRSTKNIACEVLSTLPYPIQCVLERHGLGRFRVTQKLNLQEPRDVYRIENAQAQDWIMLGTHDTPAVWSLAQEWCRSEVGAQWGNYLAGLITLPEHRTDFAENIARSPGLLVHGLCAAMFASRARYVSIFFPDLFGITERYNKPGIVDHENWRLRLPADFETFYHTQVAVGQALNLNACFSQALDARAMQDVQ
jgi:4-alpha-glucanotransferase